MLERPIPLENLWNVVYSNQLSKKFEGMKFFSDSALVEKMDIGQRLKSHISFMSKRVLLIKN
jgi:hypothetical protein